jgi:hypothetical protein
MQLELSAIAVSLLDGKSRLRSYLLASTQMSREAGRELAQKIADLQARFPGVDSATIQDVLAQSSYDTSTAANMLAELGCQEACSAPAPPRDERISKIFLDRILAFFFMIMAYTPPQPSIQMPPPANSLQRMRLRPRGAGLPRRDTIAQGDWLCIKHGVA